MAYLRQLLIVLSILAVTAASVCAHAQSKQNGKPAGLTGSSDGIKVRVSHSHGVGGCEGFIFIDEKGIRYEDSIEPSRGVFGTHAFTCPRKNVTKHELIDNTDGHDSGRSSQLWLEIGCAGVNPRITFVFEPTSPEGPSAEARRDFSRAKQAFIHWN
jgi:hypothetical protein